MDTKKKFGAIRIVFGLIWALDASFKWRPEFLNGVVSFVSEGAQDQGAAMQAWVGIWVNAVGVNPHAFAVFIAVAETLLAISLLTGIFARYAMYCGILLSLAIWSTAEGFGGTYGEGTTDIGVAVMYAMLFAALIAGKAWEGYSLEPVVMGLLGKKAAARKA